MHPHIGTLSGTLWAHLQRLMPHQHSLPCLPALALAELLRLLNDGTGAAPEVDAAVAAGALWQVVLPVCEHRQYYSIRMEISR
jgi:hypothetical protein